VKLHEAWYEIAKRIYSGKDTWICNGALRLNLSEKVREQIYARVEVERRRQRGTFALWSGLDPQGAAGRVARIRFIAAELRRLAG